MNTIKECVKKIWNKITIILLAWCLILTISLIVFVALSNNNVTNIMKNISNVEYDFKYQLDNIEYETNDIEYRIDNIEDKLDDIEYRIDDIEYNIRYR